MAKLYNIDHPVVRKRWPLIYQTFNNPYRTSIEKGKGYQLFKQVGLQLKTRVEAKTKH